MGAQLPNELLQLIFQDAIPETLRSLRLVDRQWSAAATPYLFERIHASLFRQPLAKLTALSLSALAKHVKAIHYHSDQLPGYTRTEWEASLDSRPDIMAWRAELGPYINWRETTRLYDELPRNEFTLAQLEEGWLLYQSHCHDQQSWVDGKAGLALKECLSRFYNLRDVVVNRSKPFERREQDNLYWKNFLKGALIKRNAWIYNGVGDDGLASLSSIIMMIAVGHRNSISGVKLVEELLLDLPAQFSLHDMVYLPEHYPYKDLAKDVIDPTTRSETYGLIVEAFRPLKHLTMYCPSVKDVESPESKAQIQEFNDLLTAAVNLETLNLDLGEPYRSYEGANEEENHQDHGLVNLFLQSRPIFPKLKTLHLSGSFPSHPFTVFLSMHQNTLKTLEIRDSFSDDWYKTFEHIGTFLKPEEIYFESLWQPKTGHDMLEDPDMLFPEGLDDPDDDFAVDVQNYLYTGKGRVPRLEEYEVSDEERERSDSEYDMFDEFDMEMGAYDMGAYDTMERTDSEMEEEYYNHTGQFDLD